MRHQLHHGFSETTFFENTDFPKVPESAVKSARKVDPAALIGDDIAGSMTLGILMPAARFHAADDIAVANCQTDSKRLAAGELAVYRVGVDDPMTVIADALARGAAGIVTEQLLPCPLPQCIVGDAENSLAIIRRHQLGKPDTRQMTIAVAGDAGKTTTSLLVAKMLRDIGLRTAYTNDLGRCDGIVQTTPELDCDGGTELVEFLNETIEASAQVTIVEVDSSAAAYGRYDAVEFDMLVVTGPAMGRPDFGPSPTEAIIQNMPSDGVVICDGSASEIIEAASVIGIETMTYGTNNADVQCDIIDNSGGLMTMLLNHRDNAQGDTMHVMETRLTGIHNALNMATAAAVGLLFEKPIHEIGESLGSLYKVPGRDTRFERPNMPTVIVDCGGDALRTAGVLKNHRAAAIGKLWAILAIDSQDRNLPALGTTAQRHADKVIVTSAADKSGFLAASHEVIDGFDSAMACRMVCDPATAIEWAIGQAKSDDVIVVMTGNRGDGPAERRRSLESICKLASSQLDKATEKVVTKSNRSGNLQLKVFGG